MGNVQKNLEKRREKAAWYGNQHARPMEDIELGSEVWFRTQGKGPLRAVIQTSLSNGRSYLIKSESGRIYKINRSQLKTLPPVPESFVEPNTSSDSTDSSYITPPVSAEEDIIPETVQIRRK